MERNFFKRNFFFPGWLNTWRPYFLFFLIGFIIYGQTLFFNLTYLDDQALLIDNAPILRDFKNIGRVFSDDVFLSTPKFYYRPLMNMSLMMDFSVAGNSFFIFHLVNIIIHLLAVSLIYLLLGRLKYRKILAFWLALFFLIHPVLVPAVAWIPGRNDSLLAVFVLAAFISFLNFIERPRLISYLLYFLFFLAALLTKENAVFLPLLIIFYSFAIEKAKISKQDKWLLICISAAAIFTWFLMRSLAISGSAYSIKAVAASAFNNSPAIFLFIGKIIWPFNLSVMPILADSKIIYGLITAFLIFLALFFSRRKRNNFIIFGLGWFLLFIFPSFIQPNLTEVPDFLEHRLYLPIIGLLIVLAEIDWIKNLDFRKRLVKICLLLVFLLFGFLNINHSLNFKDSFTFWNLAAHSSPHSPLAQLNLGVIYYFKGDNLRAQNYYDKALALNPALAMAHNNLGVIYMDQKKFLQAEEEFRQELEVNPGYDKAILNLDKLKQLSTNP